MPSDFINSVTVIVAGFFLLSLGVETVLENFRGLLSLFGIEALQAKKTMDQALQEAADFVPEGSKDYARFAAFVEIVNRKSKAIGDVFEKTKKIGADFAEAVKPEDKDAIIAKEKTWLAVAAAPIKAEMQEHEERRVFVLRIISAAVGIGLAWASGFNVLAAAHPGADWLGYVLGGLACAGGSSFWHDQLDRVRSLKKIGQDLAAFKI